MVSEGHVMAARVLSVMSDPTCPCGMADKSSHDDECHQSFKADDIMADCCCEG